MQKINIMIIDDDDMQVWILKRYFKNVPEIRVVFSATNGLDGLELYNREKIKIDIILLDLVMPIKDGLFILDHLDKNSLSTKVILITGTKPINIHDIMLKYGINYYFTKPICLFELKNRIFDLNSNLIKTRDLENIIARILHELGIPSNIIGYKYIKDTIKILNELNKEMFILSKDIYPVLSQKYNKNIKSIERAIRHAIEIGFNRGNIDYMEDIFGNSLDIDKSKPTNSEFVHALQDKIYFSTLT